jgi:hypothetical protein
MAVFIFLVFWASTGQYYQQQEAFPELLKLFPFMLKN